MQKSLEQLSDEQLEAELARRAEAKKQAAIPKPLDNIDWVPLTNYVVTSVKEVANGDGEPKDFEHWLFEMVMETIYGPDIWKWWNKQL
jgi:hypothetical protein